MEEKYRVVWHTEAGGIQKGILTTWDSAVFEFGFLISMDKVVWIEDSSGNKVEETPHV